MVSSRAKAGRQNRAEYPAVQRNPRASPAAAQRTAFRARLCPSKGIQVRADSTAKAIPRGISASSRGRYPAHRAARAKAKEKMASRRMGSPPLYQYKTVLL